jgi:hypothetical protein
MIVSELAWNGEVAFFDMTKRTIELPGLLTNAVFKYTGPAPPPPPPPPPATPTTPTPQPAPAAPRKDVVLTSGQTRALVAGCFVAGVATAVAAMWLHRRLCSGDGPAGGSYSSVRQLDDLN